MKSDQDDDCWERLKQKHHNTICIKTSEIGTTCLSFCGGHTPVATADLSDELDFVGDDWATPLEHVVRND